MTHITATSGELGGVSSYLHGQTPDRFRAWLYVGVCVGALEAMAVSGRSGNVRRGRGQAARQKGGGATYFDLNTGRCGQFPSREGG